jgi:hypothetical protein
MPYGFFPATIIVVSLGLCLIPVLLMAYGVGSETVYLILSRVLPVNAEG